jgi:hypothetical protein
MPITVAARSKVYTVFARLNTGVMGSNHTRGTDVCVRLLCVVLCVGSGLAKSCSPVQGVLPTVYRLRNWKRVQGPTKGWRATDRWKSNAYNLNYVSCPVIASARILYHFAWPRHIWSISYKYNTVYFQRGDFLLCGKILRKHGRNLSQSGLVVSIS